MGDRFQSLRARLNDIASVAVIVLSGSVVWTIATGPRNQGAVVSTRSVRPQQAAPRVPTEPVLLEDAAGRLGWSGAPAALVVFSDYECSYCGAFARDSMPLLKARYVDSRKLVVVFRHLPLDKIHSRARLAAESAECAGMQGKFWEMHDKLFANQARLERFALEEYARGIGIGERDFLDCLGGRMRETVNRDSVRAQTLGIVGTPTLLVGAAYEGKRVRVTEVISGAASADRVSQAIDRVLALRDGRSP